ncbi:TetR/AcrR family transcriptional regulator [Hahella sp. CR1]|uniref:TetR/AcrR family transcriptional regulator n=1 Tax=Hahella sp. CR1 TaxID=2992807 RepID=UPI0024429E14|nr:TetR/AcrR family transcriptional regulator [Hahella sp. CR1]MDG9667743.1 TetR/AcrR family transcriptional regulator [Hahella sp. CR1]
MDSKKVRAPLPAKSKQLSKTDWLEFALKQLVNKGPDSLKIMPLCEALKVTKGSFYHHFENRQDFNDALMSHWYERMTMEFIKQADAAGAPLERLKKLDQVIAAHNIEAEMHIRAWALKDVQIAEHLVKIDNQRQQYLKQCYLDLGAEDRLAGELAQIAYGLFLGLQQIHPKPGIETALHLAAMVSGKFVSTIGSQEG